MDGDHRPGRPDGRPSGSGRGRARTGQLRAGHGSDLTVEVSSESEAKKVLRLVEALDDHDDVQNVYANFDIPDAVMAAYAGLMTGPDACAGRPVDRRRVPHPGGAAR